MTVTAAGADEDAPMRRVAVLVYEAAADACLLAGNLGFYLTCQSRLLKDLYPLLASPAPRAHEFAGLSVLYFAVFSPDSLELACQLRCMSTAARAAPDVNYALQAARLLTDGNYLAFCQVYRTGSVRQRTIMHPALDGMREHAMKVMARSYRQLDCSVAARWLALSDVEHARRLLLKVRQDLEACNAKSDGATLRFVVPSTQILED
jgi:hypothetical protein